MVEVVNAFSGPVWRPPKKESQLIRPPVACCQVAAERKREILQVLSSSSEKSAMGWAMTNEQGEVLVKGLSMGNWIMSFFPETDIREPYRMFWTAAITQWNMKSCLETFAFSSMASLKTIRSHEQDSSSTHQPSVQTWSFPGSLIARGRQDMPVVSRRKSSRFHFFSSARWSWDGDDVECVTLA